MPFKEFTVRLPDILTATTGLEAFAKSMVIATPTI